MPTELHVSIVPPNTPPVNPTDWPVVRVALAIPEEVRALPRSITSVAVPSWRVEAVPSVLTSRRVGQVSLDPCR
jgi:hypothetical protein